MFTFLKIMHRHCLMKSVSSGLLTHDVIWRTVKKSYNNLLSVCHAQKVCLLNDNHRERLLFHSIQYRSGWLVAFDLFDMFTQSVKFYTFHYQYRCLKNVIHQIDRKNGWLLLSASFTAKFGLVFVLTLENAFS